MALLLRVCGAARRGNGRTPYCRPGEGERRLIGTLPDGAQGRFVILLPSAVRGRWPMPWLPQPKGGENEETDVRLVRVQPARRVGPVAREGAAVPRQIGQVHQMPAKAREAQAV